MLSLFAVFVYCTRWIVTVPSELDESIRIITINTEYEFHDFDLHSHLLKQRAQIEQVTGVLLQLIGKQKSVIVKPVFPSGPIQVGGPNTPKWSYESFLTESLYSVLARDRQLFPACYFKDNGLPPIACSSTWIRPSLCRENKSIHFAKRLIPQIGSSTLLKEVKKIRPDIVKGILYSNCHEHHMAIQLASDCARSDPDNALYRYVLSELLTRQGKDHFKMALEQLNAAVMLNSSEVQFREARLVLFLRNGLLNEADRDAQFIRTQLGSCASRKSCTKFMDNRSPEATDLTAWHPWFVLGLYNLLVSNVSQAEKDLNLALDLASAVKLPSGAPLLDSVISILRHLKAIAQHNNNNFQEAMDSAVYNAHVNPSALDVVLLFAQTIARTGFYDRTINTLNLALPLMDTLSAGSSNVAFIEILNDLPTIRRISLQLRAVVHYRLGQIGDAQKDAQACLDILSSDAICSYVKALCLLVSGNFVDSVEAMASVLSFSSKQDVVTSVEYSSLSYLKEWARYLHMNLDAPSRQFHWLDNLSDMFKQAWIRSTPLHTLLGYVNQPGIDAELSQYLSSPEKLYSIVSGISFREQLTGNRNHQLNQSEVCSYKYSHWRYEPEQCQQAYLSYLGEVLCKISTAFAFVSHHDPVVSTSPAPLVNRRHRLALALGSLMASESIRTQWCQRRRVSFTTCWSYAPSGTSTGWRAPTFSHLEQLWDSDSWSHVHHCASATRIHFDLLKPCRSPRSDGPDWFVQASLITQLLLLTDPQGIPPLWYSDENPPWTTPVNSARSPHRFWGDGKESSERTRDESHKSPSSINDFDSVNTWTDAVIRDRHYIIRHSRLDLKKIKYAHTALQFIHSLLRFCTMMTPKPPSRPLCSLDPMSDVNFFSKFEETFLSFNFSPTDRVTNSDIHERIFSSLNFTWQYAQHFGLVNEHNSVALKIHIPGRADVTRANISPKRYLGGVLVFEKDQDGNFALSTVLLSNQHHRQTLGLEMDMAFQDFLTQGEKALATILAGSNIHSSSHRTFSPFRDPYLNDAINSAFRWLYYWTLLKPIASVYSFHVGFAMVSGMLRALGVEPKSHLPDSVRNLELDALFAGSPEKFANILYEYLDLNWLSELSVSLTWFVSPEELCETPRDFIELLNLHSIFQCVLT